MTKDEALKLALEALETLHDENMDYLVRNKLGGENNQCLVFAREAITAIKEALAQTEQEPVAEARYDGTLHWFEPHGAGLHRLQGPLFKSPPAQRTWVGLTDEEIALIDWESLATKKDCVRAIEAKLKEKNT